MAVRVVRLFLNLINRFFMVPLFRLGLGAFVGNPLTGYMMVLKTLGRKTGKVRYAPVNYAILDGNLYCMAGFGRGTQWFRNLQAHPRVEVILPSGPLAGVAEETKSFEDANLVRRQLLKNSGFVGFLAGFNPWTLSDARLREKTGDFPLIRIQPAGVGSGAGDAGGWLWVLSLVVSAVVLWLVLR